MRAVGGCRASPLLFNRLSLPANVIEDVLDLVAILDITLVALFPVRLFPVLHVEDRGDMRFDGKAPIVAAGLEVAHDMLEVAVTLSGHGVFRFRLADLGVTAVLDMNMDDVLLDVVVETEGVLEGVRFGLRSITLEHRIARVEDKFESGYFFNQPEGMFC